MTLKGARLRAGRLRDCTTRQGKSARDQARVAPLHDGRHEKDLNRKSSACILWHAARREQYSPHRASPLLFHSNISQRKK